MQYMLLIYTDRSAYAQMPPEAQQAHVEVYKDLARDLKGRGRLLSTSPLVQAHEATLVWRRDGKLTHIDGPFAETKEALAGYYLIEADDLDEACAVAARIPDAALGTIEVRPIKIYGAQAQA